MTILQNIKISESFSRLLVSSDLITEHDKKLARLFCYGFRAGGFVDVAKNRINELLKEDLDEKVKFHLNQAIGDSKHGISGMLNLRAKPVFCSEGIEIIFHSYVRSVDCVLHNLNIAKEISGNEKVEQLYRGICQAVEKVTNDNGLWVMNYKDELLEEHGKIYLKDQDLFISQIVFTNIGLHIAYIGPERSFLHAHVGERYDNRRQAGGSGHGMSELHVAIFNRPDVKFTHYLGSPVSEGQKTAHVGAVDVICDDVIAIPDGYAHGGRNHSRSDYAILVFAAGHKKHGPWRADYNDRQSLEVGNIDNKNEIRDLNGAPLIISPEPVRTVVHPLQSAGKEGYGIGLDIYNVGACGESMQDQYDSAIVVWNGSGKITATVGKTTIAHDLKKGDFLQTLSGIDYRFNSHGGSLTFLRFSLFPVNR